MKPWILLMLLVACGSPKTAPRSPVLFDMHSSFWLNLHLRLHYAATGRRPPPSKAPPAPDAPVWRAAVDYYRERFGERGGMGLFFDQELIDLAWRLTSPDLDGIDVELAAQLRAVAPLVRHEWPRDDARNRAWMKSLAPLLDEHGGALRDELTAIYGVPWPKQPIRVDVSCFAGPFGAYTVGDPPHILISSCDANFAGTAGLEMIFHEASHLLVEPVEHKLAAAAKRLERPLPEHLWHAILFYTAGESVRRRFPGYVPHATRNRLDVVRVLQPALRDAWQPYLDRRVPLDVAIDRLVIAAESGAAGW